MGSKLEESRSSSSLLACRSWMSHCKIIGIINQKGFWLSESESALSTSISKVVYQLFVGSSESCLSGLLSFGLSLLSALLDWVVWGFLKEPLGAHSLTAALDQLRVVASSTSNDPGPRSRQHQQIGQWSYKAETLHLYMHRQLLERVKIFPLYVSGGHSAPQCTCDPLIYWKLLELWSWI